jgi:hypothetical protein
VPCQPQFYRRRLAAKLVLIVAVILNEALVIRPNSHWHRWR